MPPRLTSELINTQVTDGATITAAAEALLVTSAPLPAHYFRPGRLVRALLVGKASNAATTPGTLTLRCRWGGIAGTVLAASPALTQNVIAQTDVTWIWNLNILCRAGGSGGNLLTFGDVVRGNRAAAAVADITPDLIPAGTLAEVAVDVSVASSLSFTAESSVTTASITCMGFVLESVGNEYANIGGGGEFVRSVG